MRRPVATHAECGERARQCLAPTANPADNALRRLLRGHLVHVAGGKIEAHAPDLVEIGAGDADEARAVGIVDGMYGAVLIDARVSRREPILLYRRELGFCRIAAIVLPFP